MCWGLGDLGAMLYQWDTWAEPLVRGLGISPISWALAPFSWHQLLLLWKTSPKL